MKKIKRRVIRFLRRYRMDLLDVDIDTNVGLFLDEMRRGLSGRKSSLEMIPTYIEIEAKIPINKRVIAVDAGGTNFRVATVYFDDNKTPVIENLRLFPMPAVQRELGREEFFRTMAGYLKDVASAAERIGFCFSYPVEIFPNRDGRVIRFVKEIKAKEVEGQFVGENLGRAMAAMGLGGDKRIILLNDTVATLLAGVGYKNRVFGGYIGFILGTGTNCCYIEKNSNIKKTRGLDPDRCQIINTESGGFGRSHRGNLDIELDKSTNNPGVHKFEKMISGAYLGPVFMQTIQKACDEGLFSEPLADAIGRLSQLSTPEMNRFMHYPYGDNTVANLCRTGAQADIITLYCIADRLVERAARFAAINLSAMAVKSGTGADPARPLCIVAEGTTFYQMKTLKNRIEFYLKWYLENKHGVYCDIIGIDNAALVGAAIAGLTNS